MIIKRRLVVHGNVQAVGYRAYVKMIGRNLKIKGSIRNLDDGTVEIYCECSQDSYKKFKKLINRKAVDPSDLLQINVSSIEEFDEEWIGFDESKISYPFDIIYDDMELKPLEKETLERSEMAILAMTSMNMSLGSKIDAMHKDLGEKQDKMLNNQEKMLSNQDRTTDMQEKTLNETKNMHKDMVTRFDWLAEKYGDFGKTMEELKKDMREIKNHIYEIKEAFVKLTQHLTKEN